VPRWFLIINGVALLLMGVVLLGMRLRERPLYQHLLGILWSLLCCCVGGAMLLMAAGYLEQPGTAKAPPPLRRLAPDFPSGR
jgi:hypothetical protein